jgi:hypothetical protein
MNILLKFLPKCSTVKKKALLLMAKRARDLPHLNAAGDRNILLKCPSNAAHSKKNVYY